MFGLHRRDKHSGRSTRRRLCKSPRSERRIARFRAWGAEELERRNLLAVAALSIGDASIVEGDAGSANLQFVVTRTGDSRPSIVVGFATADDTAQAGSDYTGQTGTVEIPSDLDSAIINIPILGDLADEPDETFFVRLTGIVSVTGPAEPALVRTSFAAGSGPQSVATGDFNSDGRLDVVVANLLADSVSVLLNNTADGAAPPVLAAAQDFAVAAGPAAVVTGDFNGDGLVDLAVASSTDDGISVLINTTPTGSGTVSFAPRQDFGELGELVSLAAGDFNRDGQLDLAVLASSEAGSTSVLLNSTELPSPTISFSAQFLGTVDGEVYIAAADVDGDGVVDLAIANQQDDVVSVLRNFTETGSSETTFSDRLSFATAGGPVWVAVGDVNGDGVPDLAAAAADDDVISVLLGNPSLPGAGGGDFLERQDFAAGDGPAAVALVDLDGDGLVDLAAMNANDDTASVLLNGTATGSPTALFSEAENYDAGDGPAGVAVGDFNRDGRMDLAVPNRNSNQASILLNTPALIEDGEAVGTIIDDVENSPPFVAAPIADMLFNEGAADLLLDIGNVFDDVDIDTSEDFLVLSLTSNSNPGLVAATLDGDQLSLDFAPGAFGLATITVRATDQEGAFVEDEFALVVNALPVARPDVYRLSTSASSSASAATGVLVNDSDADGEGLSAELVDGPSKGSVVLNPDGSFTYTRQAGFDGFDSFTYLARDDNGQSNVASVTLLSHHACLVERLYQQVLGRSPDEAGLRFWVSRLEAGEGAGRIAEGIFESDERLNPIIRAWYQEFLSREADEAGLAYWRQVWQNGGGSENVLVGLISSTEFFQKAGGTSVGWTTALYHRLLDREPEAAGLQFWTDALDFKAISRQEIVNGFVRCNEDSERHVRTWFDQYLDREPGPAELTAFVRLLQSGLTQRDVQIIIIDSPEYLSHCAAPPAGTAQREEPAGGFSEEHDHGYDAW